MLKLPKYRGPKTENFNGETFQNPWLERRSKGFKGFVQWQTSREKPKWPDWIDLPVRAKPEAEFTEGVKLTFVNHATVLIQVNGFNFLTDPVWSKTIGPFRGIGLKRRKPPGIEMKDLPPIHAVLLSHNHYDHMDIPTLRNLQKSHSCQILTGLGNKKFLEKNKIRNVHEMDWWNTFEELSVGLSIVAVPAQHWSQRWLGDINRSLWMGFVIQSKKKNIYFAGDTGFGPHFEDIRKKLGEMHYSLLPIGAYLPRWFMKDNHMSPDEAVRAHKVIGSERTLAIHYGSFPLADEKYGQEVLDLKRSMVEENVSPHEFVILDNGQEVVLGERNL